MSQSENYRRSAGEDYLRRFPELRRWIGYRPDLPERLGVDMKAQSLRRYFRPMETDERGFCMTCSRLQKR